MPATSRSGQDFVTLYPGTRPLIATGAVAVAAALLVMLAAALSLLPGGLGGTEAVMVTLLVWKGQSLADAAAATLVIRLATLWFAVGLGVFFLYLLAGRGGKPAA